MLFSKTPDLFGVGRVWWWWCRLTARLGWEERWAAGDADLELVASATQPADPVTHPCSPAPPPSNRYLCPLRQPGRGHQSSLELPATSNTCPNPKGAFSNIFKKIETFV